MKKQNFLVLVLVVCGFAQPLAHAEDIMTQAQENGACVVTKDAIACNGSRFSQEFSFNLEYRVECSQVLHMKTTEGDLVQTEVYGIATANDDIIANTVTLGLTEKLEQLNLEPQARNDLAMNAAAYADCK